MNGANRTAFPTVIIMCQVKTFMAAITHVRTHTITSPSSGQYAACPNNTVNTPSCSTSCQSSYNVEYGRDKHFGETCYLLHGEENIMRELYNNGPVEASFAVYEDFLTYKSGNIFKCCFACAYS